MSTTLYANFILEVTSLLEVVSEAEADATPQVKKKLVQAVRTIQAVLVATLAYRNSSPLH